MSNTVCVVDCISEFCMTTFSAHTVSCFVVCVFSPMNGLTCSLLTVILFFNLAIKQKAGVKFQLHVSHILAGIVITYILNSPVWW